MPRLRRIVVPGLIVLFAWLAFAAFVLIRAAQAAERGTDEIERARTAAADGGFSDGRVGAHLGAAERAFDEAGSLLRSPAVVPMRFVPVVGRHVNAVGLLAAAAEDVARVGEEVARTAETSLRDHDMSPEGRLAILNELDAALARARDELGRVDPGSGQALAGPVAGRYEEFVGELSEARETAERASEAVRAARSLLEGPRRYLVLAANNAEMRAGSGSFLSIGVLDTAGGAMRLGEMEAAGDLVLDEGVPIDGDFADRWGWLEPNREFRNLGLTPRFDVTARLAARMWEATGAAPVDGVLAVDIVTLEAIVRATGPVPIPSGALAPDEVVEFLMHDQYLAFDARVEQSQAERREQLGAIAAAAVAAVDRGAADFTELSRGLARVAGGRHVLIWAAREDEQRGWESAGVSGKLESGDLLLAFANRGANKLDQFLEVDAELDVAESGTAVLTITAENTVPLGEPQYVAGPYPGLPVVEGEYLGLLAVTLPGWSQGGSIEGPGIEQLAVAGEDGPVRVIAAEVRVKRGERNTYRVEFAVPRHGRLRVLPDARVPPIAWEAFGQRWRGDRTRELSW